LVITAWRLGPWTRLEVRDEPAVLLDLEEWERTHPAAVCAVGQQAEALLEA
jgi:hypothetical protein